MSNLALISPASVLAGEVRAELPEGLSRAPLSQQFRAGQLLELSGSAPGKLSAVARLVAQAQREAEPVVWVAARDEASFYPPDFALAGIDLTALVVVRVPPENGAHALVRACELLLRSGAFGLVVLDFGNTPSPRGELAWQARLSGLVRLHESRLVLLTTARHEDPSLGPLIGLRVEHTTCCQDTRAVLTSQVLKCKQGGGIALSPDVRTLPAGAYSRAPLLVEREHDPLCKSHPRAARV
jgi:recombination protein RecA